VPATSGKANESKNNGAKGNETNATDATAAEGKGPNATAATGGAGKLSGTGSTDSGVDESQPAHVHDRCIRMGMTLHGTCATYGGASDG